MAENTDFTFRSLADTDTSVILDAFGKAFDDYAVSFDPDLTLAMLHRRGFAPGLSMAAFSGDDIAAFTFYGIGRYRGVLTAYDTGTGTLPAYRGRGLAGEVFRYSLPLLRQAGVERCLLEVLCDNAPAIAVYKSQGFTVDRHFRCFGADRTSIVLPRKNTGVEIRQVTIGDIVPLAGFS